MRVGCAGRGCVCGEPGVKALSTSSSRLSSAKSWTSMPEHWLSEATARGGCAGASPASAGASCGRSSPLLCGGSLPLLVRPLDDDRPMMRRTFCSRVENERGVSASSASSSSSSSLFHPRERRLSSDERVDEALRFREFGGGGSGATSVLVAAADAKLEVVADPLSPALVNVTDFEEPWSFSERMLLRRTTSAHGRFDGALSW